MARLDLPKSPNVFHPEKPSAVGSRNSLAQDDAVRREKYLKSYHGKMFIKTRLKSYLTG